MKRQFLVCLTALSCALLVGPAAAQKPPHRIGPILGVNFADVGGKDVDAGDLELESRTAWFLGAFAELALSRHFAIRPEVLYTQKGPASRMVLTFLRGDLILSKAILAKPPE